MRDLSLEVRGQVDDIDGIERALLGADTASYAQALGDEGDFGVVGHFDAQLARADNGTGLFTFLPAFLRDFSTVLLRCTPKGMLTFGLHCRAHAY